ncbi:hypothetical protein HII13_000348 [Brettanomyces bruxellensis]|nr:hypothetical protein HII13_000348 [Brettanomyces bruxellensis]
MPTFEYEDSLPKLPLPEVQSTIGQALLAVKPLSSPEQFEDLEKKAQEFVQSEAAQVIQKHLKQSYDENSSYLDCSAISPATGTVYGSLRSQTLPRNPFFILEDDPLKNFTPSQSFRASLFTVSALRFLRALRENKLSPDFTPSKNREALTMNSYYNIFGTTMVPHDETRGIGVQIKKYPSSRHIIVISRGQFYSLEVLSKETGQIWFSKYELTKRFNEILEDSASTDPLQAARSSVATFSTETKPTWRYIRKRLEETNPEQLHTIDSALFVVCLDHEAPHSDLERVQFASHGTTRTDERGIQVGTCINRLYDKLCFVVTPNSVAACIYPAAIMDGTAVLRLLSDIYTDSILRLARRINGNHYTLWGNTNTVPINEKISKPRQRKVIFKLPNDLRTAIHLAETRLTDIINQHEYVFRSITTFGKQYIKERMQLPADSVVQVAIQLAHFALYGHPISTLEPVTTRKFRDARTEPVATQSEALLELCRTFITGKSNEVKWTLFLKAVKEHRDKVRGASDGKGFERHLSALRAAFINFDLLNKLHPDLPHIDGSRIPVFLFDAEVDKLYGPEMLAANCGNSALHMFGITPSISTGFGIGYIIKDASISFVASSQWRQTDRLLDTLVGVLLELKNIWKSVVKKTNDTSLINKVSGSAKIRSQQLQDYLESIPMKMVASNQSTAQDTNRVFNGEKIADTQILGGYDYFDVDSMVEHSQLQTEMQSGASSSMITRSNSELDLASAIGRKLVIATDE